MTEHDRFLSFENNSSGPQEDQLTSIFAWHLHGPSVPFLVGAIYLMLLFTTKLLFHRIGRVSKILPESCLLLGLGFCGGWILKAFGSYASYIRLSATLFFSVLLPPIVIEAAYEMPSRAMLENFGTICVFAVFNTLINTAMIGVALFGVSRLLLPTSSFLQWLIFATLISAVDPVAVLAVFEDIHVNETLFIIVFGESLFNDAVTVVLYNLFGKIILVGSNLKWYEALLSPALFFIVVIGGVSVGILVGLAAALFTKYTTEATRIMEPIAVLVLAYFAYVLADYLAFSGILAGIACGMTMKPFVTRNMSKKSSTTVKYFLKTWANASESFIFLLLGFETALGVRQVNWSIVFTTIAICLIVRFFGTIILAALCNHRRLKKINIFDQFVMAYGGLRGAVAFALCILLSPKTAAHGEALVSEEVFDVFLSTCLGVIYFTVFIQGITIKPLVLALRIALEPAESKDRSGGRYCKELLLRGIDHLMSGVEEILGMEGENFARNFIDHVSSKYLDRWLLRDEACTAEMQLLEDFKSMVVEQYVADLNRSLPTAGTAASLRKEKEKQHTFEDLKEDQAELPPASPEFSRPKAYFRLSIGEEDQENMTDSLFVETRPTEDVELQPLHAVDSQKSLDEQHYKGFVSRLLHPRRNVRPNVGVHDLPTNATRLALHAQVKQARRCQKQPDDGVLGTNVNQQKDLANHLESLASVLIAFQGHHHYKVN